jgi:hypothetical protein
MPYTPDEIMALAEETYLSGFVPFAHDWTHCLDPNRVCALTAACLGAGLRRPYGTLAATRLLGVPHAWVLGFVDGFDGMDLDAYFYKTKKLRGLLAAGHEWGQAARRKFLENIPAEVVPQQQTARV